MSFFSSRAARFSTPGNRRNGGVRPLTGPMINQPPKSKSLAQAAIDAGATKEEITEALRVVQYVCGAGSVYTAAHALAAL